MGVGRTEGDRLAAIERLYRERFTQYLRVAIAIIGDRERALDAVQDGFADALRSRRTLRDDGALEAWVWRTVVNSARKRARVRFDTGVSDANEIASGNGSLAVEPSVVREAIAGLPERQRLVVFLRYYAELPYDEIAGVLRIRTGTVSATLHAAHVSLRGALEEVLR